MLPEDVVREVWLPCTRMASRLPLCERSSDLYSRAGVSDERVEVRTRMEPEAVLSRRMAGVCGEEAEALCREMVMSMLPEVVWMERRS